MIFNMRYFTCLQYESLHFQKIEFLILEIQSFFHLSTYDILFLQGDRQITEKLMS